MGWKYHSDDNSIEVIVDSYFQGDIATRASARPVRRLAYREDEAEVASLYFRLTKYRTSSADELSGVGVVDIRRGRSGWTVAGYDSYF
jgi:hypothetical protein